MLLGNVRACPWPATPKPLTCHTQTLHLPRPNLWPATPEALDLPPPNPRPATRKPLTCQIQTLDLPHPNLWPPTPKALDPPHVAGLTTCVFWCCLFYCFKLAIFISSDFSVQYGVVFFDLYLVYLSLVFMFDFNSFLYLKKLLKICFSKWRNRNFVLN